MSRWISFALFILSAQAWAIAPLEQRMRLEKPDTTLTSRPQPSSITWQTTQYVSGNQSYYRNGAATQTPSIAVNIQEEMRIQGTPFTAHLNVRDEYAAAERWNYLDLYELYAGSKLKGGATLNVGRKLEKWTEWEGAWGQGLFQPRYLENKLNPVAAGLTGVFLNWEGESTSAVFAVLPIHIPDFGPNQTVEDNRFVSANPWFHPPASQFQFNGVNTDIHYSIKRPTNESVLNNPGVATKVQFGKGPLMARVSYAYKPIPQLLLGFPSRGRYRYNADFMSIEIQPRVRYHHVASVDGVAQAGAWRLSASIAEEIPVDDGGPEDFTSAQVQNATIMAVSASRPLEEEGPTAARFTLGVLKVIGGDAPDRGDLAGENTLFERRFQYQEGYMAEVSKPFRGIFSRPLVTALRVIYDRMQNGAVVSMRTGMAFTENWRADLSVDMLGLLSASNAEVGDGLLSTYRTNDRVALGMSYVF